MYGQWRNRRRHVELDPHVSDFAVRHRSRVLQLLKGWRPWWALPSIRWRRRRRATTCCRPWRAAQPDGGGVRSKEQKTKKGENKKDEGENKGEGLLPFSSRAVKQNPSPPPPPPRNRLPTQQHRPCPCQLRRSRWGRGSGHSSLTPSRDLMWSSNVSRSLAPNSLILTIILFVHRVWVVFLCRIALVLMILWCGSMFRCRVESTRSCYEVESLDHTFWCF